MISAEDKEIFQRIKQKSLLKTIELEKNWDIFKKMKQAGEEILFSDFLVKRKVLTLDVLEENQVASPARKKLGSFELLSKLGSGGMGTVYLARKDQNKVAIKLLPKNKNADEKAIKRFNREFKTLNELSHKNIIRATERGFADAYNYYVMEYFESESFKDFGLSHSAKDQAFFLPLILQIAEGLKFATSKGVLHRDIKPDNILITKDSVVKIIDFGLVKWEGQEVTELTRTQSTMGTPHFISPEQAKDSKNVDERADIYSLGATYYNILTNDYPFKGNTPYEILSALLSNQLEEPQNLNPDIPDNINALILKMMAKDLEDRYANWQEVIDDINKCLHGKKINYKNQKGLRPIRKSSIWLAILSLIIVALLFLKFKEHFLTDIPLKNQSADVDKNVDAEIPAPSAINEMEEAAEVKIVPYRIIANYDRRYRRAPFEKISPTFFNHLDNKIKWIAAQNIDESAPMQEKLLAICYQTLALTGDGQDFFTSSFKDKMLYNEKFILDSQLSPGRWSSDIGLNAICTLTVIEMFAMHGSDHEELDRIISFSLANLHKDLGSHTSGFSSDVKGAELIVLMAFVSSRFCGSKKDLPHLPKDMQDYFVSFSDADDVKSKPLAEQYYLQAISKWLFRSRDEEDLRAIFESLKNGSNVENLYRQSYILSRSWRQNGVFKFVRTIAEKCKDDPISISNQFDHFSKQNGEIITNAILILSYENFYRFPSFFVLQNDHKKLEEKIRERRKMINPRSSK